MLTIGILIVGMAGGATPYARAQANDCITTPPATPTSGPTGQSQPITFTGPTAYTFTVGKAGDGFNVDSDGGSQATSISITTGTLPSGGDLRSARLGRVLTLSGTPDRGTGGTYLLTFTAYNQFGTTATRSFTLTVDEAPAITSANGTTFTVGTAGTFTVKAKGYPTPFISQTGILPSGVTFGRNGDGTATLSGPPGAGAQAAPIRSR